MAWVSQAPTGCLGRQLAAPGTGWAAVSAAPWQQRVIVELRQTLNFGARTSSCKEQCNAVGQCRAGHPPGTAEQVEARGVRGGFLLTAAADPFRWGDIGAVFKQELGDHGDQA